jgi:putative aldouronate transport system permease protein
MHQDISISYKNKKGLWYKIKKDFIQNYSVYLMVLPVILFYLIFAYKPMYGAIIAFKDFTPKAGILGSKWVGLKHFKDFFESVYFFRVFRNTITISVANLLFGFPAPIILALLINELRNRAFTRIVQTISYLPHFISLVVICGMITDFTMDSGIINDIIAFFGGKRVSLLNKAEFFVPIYVLSEIWQGVGWGSIIYLAALSGVDQELYAASTIDGANRWQQTIHITIPGISSTIIIMLILRMGNMLNVGFEKIILLYNSLTMERADVISSYVYRKGLLEFNWSFSSAVGLFNSVINFFLLISANWLSKKFNDASLW